jgi:S1-C subfamily serine protease
LCFSLSENIKSKKTNLLFCCSAVLLCSCEREDIHNNVESVYYKGVDYRFVGKKVMGGIVSIKVLPHKGENGAVWDGFRRQPEDFSKPGTFYSEWGGSGFVTQFDERYAYVVTNCHVVVGKHSKVTIILGDNFEVPAIIQGLDARTDIAVLKITLTDLSHAQKQSMKVLPWGNSDKIEAGQGIFTIGAPYGLRNSVTTGIISAINRELYSPGGGTGFLIQHSAPINTGSSGSPLFDESGNVIGVNDMLYPGTSNCGIGFAIPSNSAKTAVDRLIKPDMSNS